MFAQLRFKFGIAHQKNEEMSKETNKSVEEDVDKKVDEEEHQAERKAAADELWYINLKVPLITSTSHPQARICIKKRHA